RPQLLTIAICNIYGFVIIANSWQLPYVTNKPEPILMLVVSIVCKRMPLRGDVLVFAPTASSPSTSSVYRLNNTTKRLVLFHPPTQICVHTCLPFYLVLPLFVRPISNQINLCPSAEM
ncbi:hypothetical protein BLOT_003869, partial [Blomia tropicalis]